MRATVTPDHSVSEIERMIAENRTVVFTPGSYCFDRPLHLEGLTDRVLTGEPGAALSGVQRRKARWENAGNDVFRARMEPGLAVDGLRIGDHVAVDLNLPLCNTVLHIPITDGLVLLIGGGKQRLRQERKQLP